MIVIENHTCLQQMKSFMIKGLDLDLYSCKQEIKKRT